MRDLGEIEDISCPRCGDEKEDADNYYCNHCQKWTDKMADEYDMED